LFAINFEEIFYFNRHDTKLRGKKRKKSEGGEENNQLAIGKCVGYRWTTGGEKRILVFKK
jgi:hypothetical protein